MRAMARTDPQVNIRMPAALKQQLEEYAALSGRSFTAEVVARLEESIRVTENPIQHLVEASRDLEELLNEAELELVPGSRQDLGDGKRSARFKIRFQKKGK